MGRILPILVLAAIVLSFLAVIVLNGPIVAIVPLLTVACGVTLFFVRDLRGYIAGAVLVLFGLLAIIMSLGGVSGEGDTEVAATGIATGHAIAVVAGLVAAAGLLALQWSELQPPWLQIAWPLVLIVAAALAFAFKANLGDPANLVNYLVGLLVLAAGAPALTGMLAARDAPAPSTA